ncbi:MAG: penicillin-binding protein 2 [Tannerella sp.]|jgi:penicillin-binding protein 2|nr:penicillin-binding protein 2 [Tannerella sp.]
METNKDRYGNYNRRYMVAGAVVLLLVVFLIRLFLLQIWSDDYKITADSNAFLRQTLYPARGAIYDRKGRLLVYNQPSYDVMMIMREVEPFDTLDFCNTLNINKEYFDARIAEIKNKKLNSGYSPNTPQVFMSQLSADEFGVFQEKLFKFRGFYTRNRPLREYGCKTGANLLGYIREVDKGDIEKDDYYVQGDNAGKSGVERSYEKYLRGEKGVEILLRDAQGRIKGRYEDGEYDVAPVSGKNITLSVDMDLQELGEQLMQNKQGAIVMIEPSTGEILCLVTAPSYDPGLLVGKQRGKNHKMLEDDPLNPLLDRSIMGSYPPGSTFKPTQGLIFLQEGVITKETAYSCAGGYPYLGGRPACHPHYSPVSVVPALSTSCNSFFCWGLRGMLDSRTRYPSVQEAFTVWKNYMVAQGYGYQLGVDLPGEIRGFIPNKDSYDNAYNKRWNSSSIISIAIGQGEITATPLQICNLAATVANRGYFTVPHVVHQVQDMELDEKYSEKKWTGLDPEYYQIVVEGMRAAVMYGTCTSMALPDIEVCGKTGTAENPHGRSHSACIGFAPMNDPKVAICVYVQNGGYGASVAVPIAKLMLEKFFYGEIPAADQWNFERMQRLSTLPGSYNYPLKKTSDGENEQAPEGEISEEQIM